MAAGILVFAEHHQGKPTRAAWEALAAGQRLAADLGLSLTAIALGVELSPLMAELARAKLDEVIALESPALEVYTPEGFTSAVFQLIEARQPRLIIFSHTYQARDFAPRLAARCGRALISDCLSYRREDERLILIRPVFQGKFCAETEFMGEPPYFVSFQAGSFREDSVEAGAAPARVTCQAVTLAAGTIRTRPGEVFREAKQAVDLSQAKAIVAVGRGIKGPENLELARKLAEALGAELGASRPICDNGWLSMDRQIGSSGQTVAPNLSLALGISGAIQHLVGMKGSRTVVAINKDKEAPIFEVATYGIVGDLFEIVPPLIEEIIKAKSG